MYLYPTIEQQTIEMKINNNIKLVDINYHK